MKKNLIDGDLNAISDEITLTYEGEEDTLPPNKQTPITESGAVISALCDIWDMWNLGEKYDFMENIFGALWKEENGSGNRQLDELKKIEHMTDWYGEPMVPGFKPAVVQIAIGMAACAFAIQAFKAEKNSTEA